MSHRGATRGIIETTPTALLVALIAVRVLIVGVVIADAGRRGVDDPVVLRAHAVASSPASPWKGFPVASMPESSSKMWDFRIGWRYLIDKSSAVRVVYNYRKLTSYDAQWDAYAANPVAIQGYVGLGIASPNYKVNVVSVAYTYSFR